MRFMMDKLIPSDCEMLFLRRMVIVSVGGIDAALLLVGVRIDLYC